MIKLRHGIVILFYALPALALGIWLPQWLPLIDRHLALGIGFAVLLLGALLHETRARLLGQEKLGAQVLEARQALYHLQDDLLWTRRELAGVEEALETIGRSPPSGGSRGARPAAHDVMADALDAVARWDHSGRAVEEVMAEVKALKSLVGQVTQRTEALALSAPSLGAPSLGASALGAPALAAGAERSGKAPPGAEEPLVLEPLPKVLDEEAILDAVRAALRDDRIELVLQPVVSLPARKRHFYEAFSRLRTTDGTVLLPEQYLPVAARKGQITAIDNMILLRCVQLVRQVRRKGENIGFFCNVAPHTLRDRDFFADLVGFLRQNRELAEGMIFEFAHDVFINQDADDRKLVQGLSAIGCRLSVDNVSSLEVDLESLGRHGVQLIKVEAGTILDAAAEAFATPGRFKAAVERAGLSLIVDKIETEAELVELLDHEIDYGQGFLFGEPRSAKPAR